MGISWADWERAPNYPAISRLDEKPHGGQKFKFSAGRLLVRRAKEANRVRKRRTPSKATPQEILAMLRGERP